MSREWAIVMKRAIFTAILGVIMMSGLWGNFVNRTSSGFSDITSNSPDSTYTIKQNHSNKLNTDGQVLCIVLTLAGYLVFQYNMLITMLLVAALVIGPYRYCEIMDAIRLKGLSDVVRKEFKLASSDPNNEFSYNNNSYIGSRFLHNTSFTPDCHISVAESVQSKYSIKETAKIVLRLNKLEDMKTKDFDIVY